MCMVAYTLFVQCQDDWQELQYIAFSACEKLPLTLPLSLQLLVNRTKGYVMETKGCALGAKTATPFLSPSFLQHPSCLPPSCNTLLVSLLPATPSSFPSFLLVSLPSIHTHPLPHSPSQPFSSQLPGEHPEGPGSSHEGCLSELWGGRVCVCEARGSLTAHWVIASQLLHGFSLAVTQNTQQTSQEQRLDKGGSARAVTSTRTRVSTLSQRHVGEVLEAQPPIFTTYGRLVQKPFVAHLVR